MQTLQSYAILIIDIEEVIMAYHLQQFQLVLQENYIQWRDSALLLGRDAIFLNPVSPAITPIVPIGVFAR